MGKCFCVDQLFLGRVLLCWLHPKPVREVNHVWLTYRPSRTLRTLVDVFLQPDSYLFLQRIYRTRITLP